METSLVRLRCTYVLALIAALGTLALVLLAAWLAARSQLRQQIADRDAEALHSVMLLDRFSDDAPERDPGVPVEPNEALELGLEAALRASQLRGVLGIRIFHPNGAFADAFPPGIQPQTLDPKINARIASRRAHGRFYPKLQLSEVFIFLPRWTTSRVERVPILEATVPFLSPNVAAPLGAAQFLVDGRGIAAEFERLDRTLTLQALTAFLGASLLLLLLLVPAFRRILRLQTDITHRNQRLQQATEELAFAARASALGAISAHLLHGLRNPLASLSEFVARKPSTPTPDDADWQDALTATHRMQSLVHETLDVLAGENGAPDVDLSPREVMELATHRMRSLAAERSIRIHAQAPDSPPIPARASRLAALILVNLIENALHAAPRHSQISCLAEPHLDHVAFHVEDTGSGFPIALRPHLFLPCQSTREGGSGLGLAISKQLADHLSATLELRDPPGGGCRFTLLLPTTTTRPIHRR